MTAVMQLKALQAVHAARDAGDTAPTAEEVATLAGLSLEDALTGLVELKARKVLSDHRRGDRREWQRWGR